MTVVVFGARGQVGRHVLAGLRDAGRPVRATGRSGPVIADLDRPITVERVSPAAARAEMVRRLPDAVADRLLHMWAAAGSAPAATSPQLATRTFAEWAAAHAEDFRQPA
ncbi:hypothetical protein [Dactylosporangium matsuzakiense]|uniref:NAD-dependent epimerase/dehydratase family protein n=1 Tax=Dactylosporangium matsuzakiense TaxID=53360 RepID=A0A9W6NQ40_9ACTN|nr:hypothetical protein [Dactylosporangium matsuzakiense]UWZ40926.1 hypothetical protein Dmats_24670 [Dactylosporangium matsuzakiense]GLL04871.1 hypothetical protein GCM10017581_066180 [Dactylosporangium matsuzakiense]